MTTHELLPRPEPTALGDHVAPSVSAIVCAYTLERWSLLEECIAALAAQSPPLHQVVVVSDHNAELAEAVAGRFPDVTVVQSTGPKGLSGARNTGLALATGEVTAFVDDDAVVDPGWGRHLAAGFTEDVIGVAGQVRPRWLAPRPVWFPDEFLWVVGASYRGLPASGEPVRNPIGANMGFRTAPLTQVGGFDTDLGRVGNDGAGCEETDVAIRIGRMHPGSRIVIADAAACGHAVVPERTTRAYFRRRCWAEGRSKARLSGAVGAGSALASERRYVRSVLPRGLARGLAQGLRGDPGGPLRSAAIVEGLAVVSAGYASALARRTLRTLRDRGGAT